MALTQAWVWVVPVLLVAVVTSVNAARTAVEHWNMHRELSKIILELNESATKLEDDVDVWIVGSRNSTLTGSCANFLPVVRTGSRIGAVVYSVRR